MSLACCISSPEGIVICRRSNLKTSAHINWSTLSRLTAYVSDAIPGEDDGICLKTDSDTIFIQPHELHRLSDKSRRFFVTVIADDQSVDHKFMAFYVGMVVSVFFPLELYNCLKFLSDKTSELAEKSTYHETVEKPQYDGEDNDDDDDEDDGDPHKQYNYCYDNAMKAAIINDPKFGETLKTFSDQFLKPLVSSNTYETGFSIFMKHLFAKLSDHFSDFDVVGNDRQDIFSCSIVNVKHSEVTPSIRENGVADGNRSGGQTKNEISNHSQASNDIDDGTLTCIHLEEVYTFTPRAPSINQTAIAENNNSSNNNYGNNNINNSASTGNSFQRAEAEPSAGKVAIEPSQSSVTPAVVTAAVSSLPIEHSDDRSGVVSFNDWREVLTMYVRTQDFIESAQRMKTGISVKAATSAKQQSQSQSHSQKQQQAHQRQLSGKRLLSMKNIPSHRTMQTNRLSNCRVFMASHSLDARLLASSAVSGRSDVCCIVSKFQNATHTMLLVCYVSVPLAILRGERTKAATRSSLIPDGNRGGPAPVRTASTFSRLRMFDSSVLKVLFAEAWTETLERIEKAFFSDFDGDLNSPAEAAAYHQVVKDIQTELERSSKAFANTSSKSNINTSSKSNREYLSANARTRQLGTRTQLPSHDEIHDIDVGVNTDDTNNADDNNDNDNGLKSGSHKNTAVMKSNDTTPLTASASSVHHLESQSKSKSESGFGAPARRPGQERQQSVLSTGIPEGVEGDGDDEKEKDEKEGNEDEGKGREETLREGDEKEDQDDDDDDNEGERVKGKEEGGAGDRDHYGGSYIESRGNREKKDDSDDGEDDEDKDNKKKISDYKDSCNNDSNDRDNDDKDSDMVEYIPHPPEERRARTESKENSRNKNERKNSSKNTDEDDIVPVDTANVPKRPGRKLIVP